MINFSGKDKRAINLMFSQTKQFVVFAITTFLIVALSILTLYIVKSFVDLVIVQKKFNLISLHVVPFVLTFIVASGIMVLRTRAKALLSSKVSAYLIKECYHALLASDINEANSSEIKVLVENILRNSDTISNYYIGRNVLPFIENISLMIGLLLASLVIQPIFGLIMLFLIPFYFVAMKGIELFAHKMEKQTKDNYEINQEKINDTYEKLKNIKLLNGHEIEEDVLNELTKNYVQAYSRTEILNAISKVVLIILFSGLLVSIALGVGGILYETGNTNISSGTYLFYGLVSPLFFTLLFRTFHYELNSKRTTLAEDQIIKLSFLRSEGKNDPTINLDEIHTVKFKELVFSSNKKRIIDDLTFEVKRGEKIGILAMSKLEKDAIFEMFTKLSKQNTGEISINNCDIAKIGATYLRGVVSTIFNESNIFDDSLINNVCYPNNFDEYKYNDALYRSGLKDYISLLPEKENTIITKKLDTKALIKMEKQEFTKRVIFANAFYKDSKIYLLNDATESIAPAIETELLNEVFKLKNKITILLTSKAYLLSRCDKILILEDGATVEYGKTNELLQNRDSYFYKLIRKAPVSKEKVG